MLTKYIFWKSIVAVVRDRATIEITPDEVEEEASFTTGGTIIVLYDGQYDKMLVLDLLDSAGSGTGEQER